MTVHLTPMPTDRLPGWIERTRAEYVAERVRAGETLEAAEANALASHTRLFPGGAPAPGHHVLDVVADDQVVGYLWVGPVSDDDHDAWWVWDVEIAAEHRGQGHGRAAMTLAETVVRENGGSTLGLNVFGFNTGARALYESLGYQTKAVQMSKRV
ncbi:GNAT family N-acetyltransferase [Sanguibacter suaedae]|uniref:GNAT family N-acetyltransferase n=1 Tax=Sanguibacter suaedae TaxID=2795737 RepID=A0A934I8V7_9MICO|nr:GNAT family N-acetyltransferase [Sanguibacter suaedae]MBI9113541.1 GNAT family N-acetyltransferase [Sanguibacter suaedae]